MNSDGAWPVSIQTSSESVPSVPDWFGELTLIVQYLKQHGVLEAINEGVRFARRGFGRYEVIDFWAVLLGYGVSGAGTLEGFYKRLQPFATAFMALFGRARLPHRSTLSRFLAAVDAASVEAMQALFAKELTRPLSSEGPGGLWDRQGGHWVVFDVDGTRQAARQRAVPQTSDLPSVQRRLDGVCAPGHLGRKRGEVVRTRTTVLHSHTQQWLGTFSGAGNGDYRGELLRAAEVIRAYLNTQHLPLAQALLRLDGLYGNGCIVEDLHGLGYVMRGRDYAVLDLPQVQARLAMPPDGQLTHPETGTCRTLYDCPAIPLTPTGGCSRVIVATHPVGTTPNPVGTTREGVVYELFFTSLPQCAFDTADVVAVYLHRGSFETVLADEDQEQATDRWCSHTPCGQEVWQIISQWIWNLRLELGQQLQQIPLRLTEFAPAHVIAAPAPVPEPVDSVRYGPPHWARPAQMGGFPGEAFALQPDGTLRCPTGQPLYANERRPERDGSLRIIYAARIVHCRACALRDACQGYGAATHKPRRVSAVLWPEPQPPAPAPLTPLPPPATLPILWGDWPRCRTRRGWMDLLRSQTVTITQDPPPASPEPVVSQPLTRRQRARWRLSWAQRLARNACPPHQPAAHIQLFGIPAALSTTLGVPTL